jgi:hypothetical protein
LTISFLAGAITSATSGHRTRNDTPQRPTRGASDGTDHEDIHARACARVALVLVLLSTSFGLAGCAAIEELRETFLRWVEAEKLPTRRGVAADDLSDATPVITPEKPPQKEASKPSKKQVKSVHKSQRPQTVVLAPTRPLIPNSTEAVRPEGTEGQSAPSQPTPRWLPSRWRQAPPPDRFSR